MARNADKYKASSKRTDPTDRCCANCGQRDCPTWPNGNRPKAVGCVRFKFMTGGCEMSEPHERTRIMKAQAVAAIRAEARRRGVSAEFIADFACEVIGHISCGGDGCACRAAGTTERE